MSKELFVSSTPHETKVAVVEEDQLTEIYFERENEYTLAGSIYKGRVSRVLPGMQSAFVDIGLERDAFLYVTDFFEPQDDDLDESFETIPNEGGSRNRYERRPAQPRSNAESGEPQETEAVATTESDQTPNDGSPIPAGASHPAEDVTEPVNAQGTRSHDSTDQDAPPREAGASDAQTIEREHEGRDRRRFGRRRGRRGRGFPESKFDSRNAGRSKAPEGPPPGYQPIILPGESISKYRNRADATSTPAPEQRSSAAIPAESSMQDAFGEGQSATVTTPREQSNDDRHHAEQSSVTPVGFATTVKQDVPQANQPAVADVVDQEIPLKEAVIEEAEDRAEPSRRDTEEIDVDAILRNRREKTEQVAEHRFGSLSGLVEDDEYEDFEEEMLDRLEGGPQLGQDPSSSAPALEVSETGKTDDPHGQEEYEGLREQEEHDAESVSRVDNPEMQAGGHHDAMRGQGEAEGEPEAHAETRGPSGYQQKVAFDRGPRRRRGGRRVRGHGKRFHRAPLPQISDLLKEGQEVLVQIAKEPIGKKGARITSHIALPGRFLVYMPTVNHNGVSRKIASEEERHRLKRIILSERQAGNGHQGGFIVRTAAAHANEEDLRADIRFLLNLWNEIKNRMEASKAPALIYHDLNLVERILRDQVSEGFSHIWVDSEQEYERIVRFVNRFQPQLVKRVKLYTKDTPLFEQFNIQEEINKALKSKVWLKSGGYIVINQTEALVAIDVNTGKFVGKTQKLEDTIVKTNVDAIKEIVRQIRLRDLGGIIVIDFIDMDERRNRQKVMQALEEALKADRAPSKVLQFNDFGLVAITRKRVKQSLERTLGQPCVYCTGTGLIKSVATVCNEIYVEMRKMARHLEGKDVFVRVNPEVGKALKANNARWLQDMEELTGKTVIVKPDPTLHQEQFDMH